LKTGKAEDEKTEINKTQAKDKSVICPLMYIFNYVGFRL
jgi:hypothetical protein